MWILQLQTQRQVASGQAHAISCSKFKVCIQEKVDGKLNDSCTVWLMSLLKIFSMKSVESSQAIHKFCQAFVSDIALIVVQKFRCDLCDKSFKDRTHLTVHIVRIHSELPCLICNLVYPDKPTVQCHPSPENVYQKVSIWPQRFPNYNVKL